MGGGCVDAVGGEVSVRVPEGLGVFGGTLLEGSSLGVAPCVMGGEATSVGEGKSVGVTRVQSLMVGVLPVVVLVAAVGRVGMSA